MQREEKVFGWCRLLKKKKKEVIVSLEMGRILQLCI